jgi:cysteine synthase A
MAGAVATAKAIAASEPERYVLQQQFANPANPQVHHDTMGPEIWKDTDGQVHVLVSGVGTGGAITGVSRYIKSTLGQPLLSVAVELANSPVISQTMANQELRPGPHRIQGIGAGFVPDNLVLDLVDRVETVTDEEAIAMARRLTREEGILAGISCGAATVAALRIASDEAFREKTIVVVLPDSGERYLSTGLFKEMPPAACSLSAI